MALKLIIVKTKVTWCGHSSTILSARRHCQRAGKYRSLHQVILEHRFNNIRCAFSAPFIVPLYARSQN